MASMRVILGLMAAATTLLVALPTASALTPADGVTYPNRVSIGGECGVVDYQQSDRHQGWLVATMDPRRVHGGDGGVHLLPANLPRWEEMPDLLTDSFAPVPRLETRPVPEVSCQATALSINGEASGGELVIRAPGPYIFMQYDYTVHWTFVPDNDPITVTDVECAENDPYLPLAELHPPAPVAGGTWVRDHHCNKVTIVRFFVEGVTGKCPVVADMSQWPAVPYINQYDAGARAQLPFRFGYRGGNACGPSALLMTLLAHGAQPLGVPLESLPLVFDYTMERPRSQVIDGQRNAFHPTWAVAYLKSLGFLASEKVELPRDFASASILNLQRLAEGLAGGPVILRTAFGSSRWGESGGGHMIEVLRTSDDASGYVVNDPAGNYFSSVTQHYAPGKCGYEVTYPSSWMKAMVVGGWFISLGPHSPVHPRAIGSLRAAATASLGTAVAVTDTHPDAADAPRSFYLQDSAGRRAGWIDGAKVDEIPFAHVDDPDPEWDDTSSGDPDLDPNPQPPPPTPRAIVLGAPQPGVTLHVVADPAAAFALTVDAWVDGARVARDELTGAGTGQDGVVGSPALEGLLAPVPTPPTPPAPPAPPPPSPPTVPATPAVSRLAITPAAFRAAPSGASARSAAARGRRGAREGFRLTAAAGVRFTVERRADGRRVGGRCVALSSRNRRARSCDRYLSAPGSFVRPGTAGDNVFVFSGRMAGRALRPGRYRLVAVPSAGGRRGAPARAPFRIVA